MNWQQSERPPALVAHPPAASLDEAHLAIELWEYYSRKSLDDEQRLAIELMMAETADGRWAADTTGRAVSRQNGKGDEIEVVELYGLLQRGEAILHTAHEAATAASAHSRLVSLVEGHRDLARRVKKKQSWNGNYSLTFDNDAQIVWRTRTGAGGRGLDDISRIIIDEAQHAQPEELASSLPVLSVNPNPQKNFMGSGGVAGKSDFWWRQRRRALQATPGRFSWLEHSAERISLGEDGKIISVVGDVHDPEVWKLANPAYPSRISHDFLADQLETLGPELFAREHLCVWDPDDEAATQVIPADAWVRQTKVDSELVGPIKYGIAVAEDRSWSCIAAAGESFPHGVTHGEIVDYRPAVRWVIARATEIKAAHGGRFGIVKGSPASSLIPELLKAGLVEADIVEISAEENAKHCGQVYDAVVEARFVHRGEGALTKALQGAVQRPYGDAWAWSQRKSTTDICPLVAVTSAAGLHGLGEIEMAAPDVILL